MALAEMERRRAGDGERLRAERTATPGPNMAIYQDRSGLPSMPVPYAEMPT